MKELRLAIRSLRATPVVTTVAFLSLALGIGANTAIFSLVNSLILRPLPVAGSDRLVVITTARAMEKGGRWGWAYPVWDQVRRRPELFDGAVAFQFDRFNLNSGGEANFAQGLWIDSAFFSTLGVPAMLGRVFAPTDDSRGIGPDGPIAVISYRFWQRHFDGEPAAIGHTLKLDGTSFTIIGVTPSWFFGPEADRAFDVAVPLAAGPLLRGNEMQFDSRGTPSLTMMARLKVGQSRDAAAAALRAAQQRIWDETVPKNALPAYRQTYLGQSFALAPGARGESNARRTYGRPLVTIMVVVALLLLIACGNIANLMLGRGSARRHELSLRRALGASRWNLVLQLFAESVMLAVAGTVAGVAIATWGSQALVRQLVSPHNPVSLNLALDLRMLMFTIAVGTLTALLPGVLPAIKSSGAAPIDALRGQSRSTTQGGALVAGGLVVAQVALSLMLVVVAGLFVRTFASLVRRPVGFDRNRVLLATVDARQGVPVNQRLAFSEGLRSLVRAIPDVGDAAVSMTTPASGSGFGLRIEVSGGKGVQENVWGFNGLTNVVTPGFFNTFGTPLIAGRDFGEPDTATASRVAIVNQTLARAALGGANPLGHTITLILPSKTLSAEIVGVVGDSVYMSMREVALPTVYTPLAQFYFSPAVLMPVTVSIRPRNGSPSQLTKSVAAAIASQRPDAILTLTPLTDHVNTAIAQERILATLSLYFGGLALLLAAIGLYGVVSHAVMSRRAEIGIRMALGAAPFAIMGLTLSRVAMLVVAGVLAGGLATFWAARFITTLLYAVTPHDPVSFVTAAIILAVVGAIAGGLPAWHSSRIDPAEVLREN